jgi:hypothetical protein
MSSGCSLREHERHGARVTTGLARLRARRRRWALLALPALALRALIPAGFMPVAGAQGLGIEFCPDAAALPPGLARPADAFAHHHHHHSAGGSEPSSAIHHAPCLFAASATLAAAPDAASVPGQPAVGRGLSGHALSARPFVPSIIRAQSPRAPPLLQR